MDGTTLCPHCETRFKITGAQLATHQGMARCGNCLQIFDARVEFIPDQPNPQLELLIDVETQPPTKPVPSDEPDTLNTQPPAEEAGQIETIQAAGETDTSETALPDDHAVTTAPENDESVANEQSPSSVFSAESTETAPDDLTHAEAPDIGEPAETADSQTLHTAPARPLTLAEQITIVHDEDDSMPRPKRRNWPWVIASLLLLLVLIAQAAYLFRVDLAARMPELKPTLVEYCRLLNCSIALPRHADTMSIESSSLEADLLHENQITLNALLRNRAAYAQAFPSLELTLNDTQDQPLARRTFRPADYLPPAENEKEGLLPNHELNIKLRLDTTDLKPTGYRLVLFYPG